MTLLERPAVAPAWEKDGITIYQGDCLAILPTLAAESVDAVITDPPYGMGKDFGNGSDVEQSALWLVQSVMPASARLLRRGGLLFAFGSPRLIHRTIASGEMAGLNFHRLLWMYKPNDCTYPWRGWLLKSEAIAVFSRGKPDKWTGSEYCHDTYVFNHTTGELPAALHHPSVKPMSVVLDIVTKIGAVGLILDPFMGSGTTLVAAKRLGRRAIGIELVPEYVEIAVKRLEAEG